MVSTSSENGIEAPAVLAHAPPKKFKRLYANYIRTIAAFAVVQMHSVGELLFSFQPEASWEIRWWTGNIFYSALRWATPFFIMLSGSFMLAPSRDEPTGEFLKKRIGRVLIPFAFWSVVYLLYDNRGRIYDGNLPGWRVIRDKILFEDVYYHLWFIPMIVSLYLLTPVFRVWIKQAHRSDIEYFLGLSFCVTALQHLIPNLFVVKYVGWLGYIGFYVLGYYLCTYPVRRKSLIYALAIFMPALTAIGTWWLTAKAGAYDNKFYVYFSPNVVIMTFALFLFLRDYDWSGFADRHPRVNHWVNQFADLSFGVYFLHVLVLDVMKNGYEGQFRITYDTLFSATLNPLYGTVIQALIAIAISVGLIYLLSKIPFIKKWLM